MGKMNALGWSIPEDQAHMIWTGWKNGSMYRRPFSGFGLRVSKLDRDEHFNRAWKTVFIMLSGPMSFGLIEVNVDKESFWRDCSELIDGRISAWMFTNKLAPWNAGFPPRFKAILVSDRKFIVEPITALVN